MDSVFGLTAWICASLYQNGQMLDRETEKQPRCCVLAPAACFSREKLLLEILNFKISTIPVRVSRQLTSGVIDVGNSNTSSLLVCTVDQVAAIFSPHSVTLRFTLVGFTKSIIRFLFQQLREHFCLLLMRKLMTLCFA